MKILINFGALKKGGGQNVALNFLHGLFEINDINNQYFFLVVKNSEIHHFLKKKPNSNVWLISSSPVKRIFQEYFKYSYILKKNNIDIIYSYFGYGLFANQIPQVCGVAVSNVFFPEIKFWTGGFLKTLIHKAIDKYRIFGIKKASALIFENKTMEERGHALLKLQPSRTIFIPPSFNPDFEKEEFNHPDLKRETVKILMLCGWQLNKNIMNVPKISSYLKKSSPRPFQFIITAPKDNSRTHNEFSSQAKKHEVEEMISIIGPIKKQYLQSLYAQIDYVLLMSKLESFSNNIIESWYFMKPLIVSDEQWAKDICKNGSLYINRELPEEIAGSIEKLHTNIDFQNELIKEGLKQLKNYPSIVEKTKMEISFIEQIHNETKAEN